jgi:multidrug efflux system membrane fusion protein
MKKSLKLYSAIAVLAVVAGCVVAWKSAVAAPSGATGASEAGSDPAVSVATVQERLVTEWDEFSGRIKAVDCVAVRPQVSGIVDAVHFADGQLVRKGDLLFTIDPRPFQAALARAQADLAASQSKLSLATSNLQRSEVLIRTHAISQSEFDSAQDNYLQADANVKSSDAALLTAQLNLNYTTIAAPVTGRVSRAEITAGNLVEAGLNAPVLTTVVSVSPVYVEFEMDEQTYLKYATSGAAGNTGIDHIRVAMGLANQDGYPNQGHLESLDNQLDTTSGTIRVRAVFDNPDNVFAPGLFARVRVGAAPQTPSILADDRAIGTDQDKKYVMVVDESNRAQYRAVALGSIVDGMRVVRSGLQKGERIVVNGLQRVRPNALVNPSEVAMDRNPSGNKLTANVR